MPAIWASGPLGVAGSSAGSLTHANPGKGARRLLSQLCFPRASAATMPRARLHSSLAVNVSLLRTAILWHWREPLLIQQRTRSDVSTLLLLCAWGDTATPPYALPDHPKAVFLVD